MKSFQEFITEGGNVKVNKQNYSWGRLITLTKGSSNTAVLHPEHQEAIKNLKDGETTAFKDEQGKDWKATRKSDKVHLSNRGSEKMVINHADVS